MKWLRPETMAIEALRIILHRKRSQLKPLTEYSFIFDVYPGEMKLPIETFSRKYLYPGIEIAGEKRTLDKLELGDNGSPFPNKTGVEQAHEEYKGVYGHCIFAYDISRNIIQGRISWIDGGAA